MYKNYPYEEKHTKSITFLFIAGIAAIVIAQMLIKKRVVNIGLTVGGALLILTSLVVNWDNLSDEIKLCVSGVTFAAVIWYFNYHYDQKDDTKSKNKMVANS
jgi:hypothetical protein